MRAWTVRGGSVGEDGWGLRKVRGMEGALSDTAGPPCHRICVCVWGWRRGEGYDFILTVLCAMLPLLLLLILLVLHRGRDRMQEVQNACIDCDDG